ncbi:hypothetical protein AALP_AA7G066200, partial [Arabis alpina]
MLGCEQDGERIQSDFIGSVKIKGIREWITIAVFWVSCRLLMDSVEERVEILFPYAQIWSFTALTIDSMVISTKGKYILLKRRWNQERIILNVRLMISSLLVILPIKRHKSRKIGIQEIRSEMRR